eukprot:gene57481-biopygen20700
MTFLAAARCCNAAGTECESDLGADKDCHSSLSYDAASSVCESHASGWRLCTKGELESKLCCGTGCGHDGRHAWVYNPSVTYSKESCKDLAENPYPGWARSGSVASKMVEGIGELFLWSGNNW